MARAAAKARNHVRDVARGPLALLRSHDAPGGPARPRWLWRAISARMASSLSRRIVVLNLAGLVALLIGYLYFNQFRAGLIEARVGSLLTQGEIIAGAVAAQASVAQGGIELDPDRLIQLQAGEGVATEEGDALRFSINPERVAPLLRRLVQPTKTRARVFDRDGMIIVDTRSFLSRGDVLRPDVAPPSDDVTVIERNWNLLRGRFGRTDLPLAEDANPTNGRALPEVVRALSGVSGSVVRVNQRGETVVSVAVSIQRGGAARGALLLSTQGGDIDAIIAAERLAIVRIFLVAAGVMVVLSFLLANTIAEPMRRLADAADRVRRGASARVEIPDFTARADEIGHLSGALRDMTRALYSRIEAIESFAADVAHELKNPLTSLRSAVETLPLARSETSRARLLEVIQHDVRRLDRLITDISDASRLDAELARDDSEPVDVARLAQTVVSATNEVRKEGQAAVRLHVEGDKGPGRAGPDRYFVMGHDSRLGQVLSNLLDNARSFSPPGSEVRVRLARLGPEIEVAVEDEGPGIPEDALERVFERFYTDRPEEQGFGQNSGLGLSISRQIVEAHGGRIRAQNRLGAPAADGVCLVEGACFVMRLPAAGA